MVKIDLSALKKWQEENTTTEINEVSIEENYQTPKKRSVRISLKDLNLESNSNSLEKKASEKKDDEPKKASETKNEHEEKEIFKIKINKNQIVSQKKESELKENTEFKVESENNTEKVNITDSDTNCVIVQEEKQEIFSSYKWSYSKENKEKKEVKKAEIKEEKVKEVKKEEPKKIEEVKEIKVEKGEEKKEEKSLKKDTEKKTNLERFKLGFKKERLFFKKINSKIIWLLSLVLVIISGGIFINLKPELIKWNIQEFNNFSKNEKKVKEENNTHNDNLNNVKEINITKIDNADKSLNMRKNIEDYLIKKYKNN